MKKLSPKKCAVLLILGVSCITVIPLAFLFLNMACAYDTNESVLAHLLKELEE
jgi:spore maturation protein SpmA